MPENPEDPKPAIPETSPTLASATSPAEPKDVEAVEEERAAQDEAAPIPEEPEAKSRFPQWTTLAMAAGVAAAFFFFLPPLGKSGLWDPYELNVADLSRRIGLNLFHAAHLALDGAENGMPHLNDLGRPELPFESIALGFKLFGLHEWAGRLPLAVWGVAGVLATYAAIARLVDKRAGLYSAVVLTTTPLYFVQARTMIGDVVAMASFAMAFGGLAVAIFDRDDEAPTAITKRLPWIGMAIVGLVAGWLSRGGWLCVAAPCVGVAAAWLAVHLSSSDRARDGIGGAVAAVAAGLGIYAAVSALTVMNKDPRQVDLSPWIGAMIKPPGKYPTFDYYVGHIAHSCAPWAAFAPFAIGRLFIAPIGKQGGAAQRESDARVALLVGVTVAFVAHGWLARYTDLIPFVAPALLAAICGVAIRDYERGAHPSIAVGVGTLILLALFHHDFHELPEKAYQAFGVASAAFPESFKNDSLMLWWIALGLFAVLCFFVWVERDSKRTPFDPAEYLKILRALRDAWDGLLALAYFALVAGFSIGALAIWIGVKTHAKWLPNLSQQVRDGLLNAWWVTAFVPLAAILGIFFACDLFLWAFARAQRPSWASLTRGFEPFEGLYAQLTGEAKPKSAEDKTNERLVAALVLLPLMVLALPAGGMVAMMALGKKPLVGASIAVPSGVALFLALGLAGDLLRGRRGAFLPVVGVVSGFVLCFFYYPALANQLSPKEVFESYQKVHKGSEPLALFGVGGRTAAYYAGGQPMQIHDPQQAWQWLSGAEPGTRRYMAIQSSELAKLNSIYREHSEPRTNLPVLDARSSQILLVASSLEPGDKEQNPLDKILLSSPPKPQRPLDVNMEDKLQVLGYDITDADGRFVNSVVPGRAYRMKTYYRVLSPITTEWEAFIHIDGFHRRHNGDHKPMDGKYPFSLWLPGDLLVDDYEFKLEPNFSPGNYTVYFGLFVGDTRLKVKSGRSDGENRINGGELHVQ